jgi:hypothetical protein
MECFKNHGFENEGRSRWVDAGFRLRRTPANCLQGQASPPSAPKLTAFFRRGLTQINTVVFYHEGTKTQRKIVNWLISELVNG